MCEFLSLCPPQRETHARILSHTLHLLSFLENFVDSEFYIYYYRQQRLGLMSNKDEARPEEIEEIKKDAPAGI